MIQVTDGQNQKMVNSVPFMVLLIRHLMKQNLLDDVVQVVQLLPPVPLIGIYYNYIITWAAAEVLGP